MTQQLSYIACILLISFHSLANTIRVGPQHRVKTITEAVTICSNGDTILVEPGLYKEKQLVIDKEIYLKGLNHPVLDGEGKYQVVTITAYNATIDGFKIINTGSSSTEDIAGIQLNNTYNVTVRNNILDNTVFGIYLLGSNNCLVEKNTIVSYGKIELQSGNGIHCWKSDSLKIIGNNISGHRDGIYFEFVSHSIIWRNVSHNNLRYGLHFMFSNNDSYITNVFRGNGAGVAVMYSTNVKMFHNYFEENWGDAAYGLLLKDISDSHIEGNRFSRNTIAIYMEAASRILMHKNIFNNNGWAMKMQANCMDVTVERNNFLANTFDVGTNGSLVLNTFDYNYWDKYEGYDLDKNKLGDVPYRPVSMYSMIIEQNPPAMILFRSFITTLLDKTEKVLPSLTPENLIDNHPLMKPLNL